MTRPHIVIVSRTEAVRDQFASELAPYARVDTYRAYDDAMEALHALSCWPDYLVVHAQGLPPGQRGNAVRPSGTTITMFRDWLRRRGWPVPVIFLRRKGMRRLGASRGNPEIRLPLPPGAVVPALRSYIDLPASADDLVRVDVARTRVAYMDESTHVTRMEALMLSYLQRYAGRVVTTDELMVNVWQYHPVDSTTLVRAHISNLRRRLASIGIDAHDALQTVRATGYRWVGLAEHERELAA